MFSKTVTTILILSLLNGFLSVSINNTDDDSDRIVGGSDAPISRFPYQVSLQYNKQHRCGGAVYDNQTIITAAHCVDKYGKKDLPFLSVVLGTSTWKSGGLRIPFDSFVKHQNFDAPKFRNDIALIKMKSKVKFTDKIQPVPIATKIPNDGDQVVATGWGALNNSKKSLSEKLQGVQLDFFSREACTEWPIFYEKTFLPAGTVCAGAPQKGSCKGDSGGPLIDLDSKELVGIVSAGGICGDQYHPGVFSNVPAFSNWITSTAKVLSKKLKK